jgi:phage terminase small subunit
MCTRKHGSTLTDKEKMFCQEYIIDLDATQAAIRAGYSEDSAKTTAYHVKQRPEVEAYINELIEKRMWRLRITADDVLIELSKIAFAEPVDFNPQNNPQPSEGSLVVDGQREKVDTGQDSGNDTGKTIILRAPKHSAATMYRVTDVDAETGRRSVRYFSLPAKIAALRLLGRHLGLFGTTGKGTMAAPNIIFPREMLAGMNKKAA